MLCETGRRAGDHPFPLLLDIIHAIEDVWKAAWSLHAKGDRAVERWALNKPRRLLAGKVSTVAAATRRRATLRGRTASKRNAMHACANDLPNPKHMMRYDTYLSAGMPIGTGVIDGACRQLAKDRMEITGAR